MNRQTLIFLLFFLSSICSAQPKSNYELLKSLVDSSVQKIHGVLKPSLDPIVINFKSDDLYETLESNLISGLTERGIQLTKSKNISKEIDYQITSAAIEYGEVFKDGLFGGYKLTRSAELSGSFTYTVNNMIETSEDFSFTANDTIDYDDARSLENISMPFTHDELPDEPLLPSLIEPAIAVATIAVTIILFFTVRSK